MPMYAAKPVTSADEGGRYLAPFHSPTHDAYTYPASFVMVVTLSAIYRVISFEICKS